MSRSLVEVTGEVARGAELEVALGTPVLGIVLRRVLHYHPRIEGLFCGWEDVGWIVDGEGVGEEDSGGMWEALLIRRTRTRDGGRHRPSELNGGCEFVAQAAGEVVGSIRACRV